LQQQLRQQQTVIDSLSQKVTAMQEGSVGHSAQPDQNANPSPSAASGMMSSARSALGNVRISGEGGVAFFETGSKGTFPNSEFRIDEARLFVEAPVLEGVYAFSEINMATREQDGVQLGLGEAYLDFENVSRLWGQDQFLSIRLGRIYTPFGEEYQTRYAIDNPLISHSLADLWAVDEGVELYGSLGKFSYAVAVQNGGLPDSRDFDPDKSLAGRVSFDPTRWLHLSVSGMRTGELNSQNDSLSAMWFGNGFFRSMGSTGTTKFHADLVEGDVQVRLPHGHVKAFGGYIAYGDNDPLGHNHRDVYYYSIEGIHDVIGKLYAGFRFSQIMAHRGFPIVANGDFDSYLFDDLTTQIWRLSLGVGYRFSPNLVLKAEYSFGRGKTTEGEKREHDDLFGIEAAFKF
jgi:hypothetical protein